MQIMAFGSPSTSLLVMAICDVHVFLCNAVKLGGRNRSTQGFSPKDQQKCLCAHAASACTVCFSAFLMVSKCALRNME